MAGALTIAIIVKMCQSSAPLAIVSTDSAVFVSTDSTSFQIFLFFQFLLTYLSSLVKSLKSVSVGGNYLCKRCVLSLWHLQLFFPYL